MFVVFRFFGVWFYGQPPRSNTHADELLDCNVRPLLPLSQQLRAPRHMIQLLCVGLLVGGVQFPRVACAIQFSLRAKKMCSRASCGFDVFKSELYNFVSYMEILYL